MNEHGYGFHTDDVTGKKKTGIFKSRVHFEPVN